MFSSFQVQRSTFGQYWQIYFSVGGLLLTLMLDRLERLCIGLTWLLHSLPYTIPYLTLSLAPSVAFSYSYRRIPP